MPLKKITLDDISNDALYQIVVDILNDIFDVDLENALTVKEVKMDMKTHRVDIRSIKSVVPYIRNGVIFGSEEGWEYLIEDKQEWCYKIAVERLIEKNQKEWDKWHSLCLYSKCRNA